MVTGAQQDIHQQKILILDFGSQYTQLIARRVREAGVYCEIKPFDVPADAVEAFVPQDHSVRGARVGHCRRHASM